MRHMGRYLTLLEPPNTPDTAIEESNQKCVGTDAARSKQTDAPCRAPPTRVACKCVTYDGTELTYAIESVYLRMVMLWSPSTPPISESAKLSAGQLNVQANFIAEWDPSLGIREAGTAEFLHFGRKSLERGRGGRGRVGYEDDRLRTHTQHVSKQARSTRWTDVGLCVRGIRDKGGRVSGAKKNCAGNGSGNGDGWGRGDGSRRWRVQMCLWVKFALPTLLPV